MFSRLLRTTLVAGGIAVVLVSTAAALRFSDESYLTPTGVVGSHYSHRFSAPAAGGSGAGCDPPYLFAVDSGALPPGLSLGSNDGVVRGTPTQAGSFSFWVSIKDDPTDKPWCNPLSAEREFTITILDRLVIGPESIAPGTVGVPYSVAMTASLPGPKAWSLVQGTLPPGVTLDGVKGVISGTPTAAGSYSFTVRGVLDASRSDTKALTLVVRDPVTIAVSQGFSTAHTARAEVGAAFRAALTASGGTGAYTWTVSRGAFPVGLALARTGAVSGRPRETGTYRFTVTAADAEGRAAAFDAVVRVAARLAIATLPLRAARVGRPYRARLRSSGGLQPVRWRIASGVPPRGLRLDPASGIIAGIPTVAGSYRVRVECIDALGVRAVAARTLIVVAS